MALTHENGRVMSFIFGDQPTIPLELSLEVSCSKKLLLSDKNPTFQQLVPKIVGGGKIQTPVMAPQKEAEDNTVFSDK